MPDGSYICISTVLLFPFPFFEANKGSCIPGIIDIANNKL